MPRQDCKRKYTIATVCFLIAAMDLAAGLLGFQAELAQTMDQDPVVECQSHQSFKLGVAATALLLAAHATANVLGGCHLTWSVDEMRRASPCKQIAMFLLLLSWMILVIGVEQLVAGVFANSGHYTRACQLSSNRYLSMGGLVCLFHGILAATYYFCGTAASREERLVYPHGPTANPPRPVNQPAAQAPPA